MAFTIFLSILLLALSLMFIVSAISGFDAIRLYVGRSRAMHEFALLRAEANACQSNTELYTVFCRMNKLVHNERWLFDKSMLQTSLAALVSTKPEAWTQRHENEAKWVLSVINGFSLLN